MKKFAILGASGYIAPKHFKAIKETNNDLVAALDNFDSVGIIDSYFPKASFFVEIERFDRHIEKIKSQNGQFLDYVSICTPNYLHDSHIRMSLRWGCDAICEKPLVLNPWNLNSLNEIERKTGNKVYTILQLREHQTIQKLKKKIQNSPPDKVFDIDLTYITSRGNWYYSSWKGNFEKSGGLTTNIGIHFFDMLAWIFGEVKTNITHLKEHDRASGFIEFERARVRWFLSINSKLLPENIKKNGKATYRSIKIDNDELEFSEGFQDLHTKVYRNIINKKGLGIEDARKSIEIVHEIRNSATKPLMGDYHPYSKSDLSKHPFKL